MDTLEIYNLCLDVISRELDGLAEQSRDGVVVGVYNAGKVELIVFPTVEKAEAFRSKLPDPDASPVMPICADLALML